MKARYLAAALIGAWWLRRRANRQAYTGPARAPVSPGASGSRPRSVPGTPFRVRPDGVEKPEARESDKDVMPGF